MSDEPRATAYASGGATDDLLRGLPMVSKYDPEALGAEKTRLAELAAKPLTSRLGAYLSLSGPGFMQSAFTLGAGTCASSLFAGAALGYRLLWVQPVAMLLGLIMMNAIAHQVLSTEVRPYHAMRRYLHPSAAWVWAFAALVASLIFSLSQFALSESVIRDMASMASVSPQSWVTALAVFLFCAAVAWSYGRHIRGIRIFENILKIMVAMILVSFAVVVIKLGIDWGRLYDGFVGFHFPTEGAGLDITLSAVANAVGINMTFLFPYTLLARGWGREHRGLARFDLSVGMFLPFVLGTALVIVASAQTLHGHFDPSADSKPQAVDLAVALEPAVGPVLAHIVFGLGVLGMTLSSIILMMLVCGFIGTELFGVEPGSAGYRVCAMLPAVGMLAPLFWSDYGFWVAIPASVTCLFFLPIAYICFFILHNRRDFLQKDMPRAARRLLWNLAMLAAIVLVTAAAGYGIYDKAADFINRLS